MAYGGRAHSLRADQGSLPVRPSYARLPFSSEPSLGRINLVCSGPRFYMTSPLGAVLTVSNGPSFPAGQPNYDNTPVRYASPPYKPFASMMVLPCFSLWSRYRPLPMGTARMPFRHILRSLVQSSINLRLFTDVNSLAQQLPSTDHPTGPVCGLHRLSMLRTVPHAIGATPSAKSNEIEPVRQFSFHATTRIKATTRTISQCLNYITTPITRCPVFFNPFQTRHTSAFSLSSLSLSSPPLGTHLPGNTDTLSESHCHAGALFHRSE
jgi:hypothetical protein